MSDAYLLPIIGLSVAFACGLLVGIWLGWYFGVMDAVAAMRLPYLFPDVRRKIDAYLGRYGMMPLGKETDHE